MNETLLYIIKNPKKEKHEQYKHKCIKDYSLYIQYNKDIEILKNENGKPYIKDNPFYFNISHSHDYYLIVCSCFPIGIDIEKRKERNYRLLAKRYYTSSEQEYVDKNGKQGFFDIWSMKESYTKYLGETIIQNLHTNMVNNTTLITNINDIMFIPISIDNEYSCYITTNHQITIKEIYL